MVFGRLPSGTVPLSLLVLSSALQRAPMTGDRTTGFREGKAHYRSTSPQGPSHLSDITALDHDGLGVGVFPVGHHGGG